MTRCVAEGTVGLSNINLSIRSVFVSSIVDIAMLSIDIDLLANDVSDFSSELDYVDI